MSRCLRTSEALTVHTLWHLSGHLYHTTCHARPPSSCLQRSPFSVSPPCSLHRTCLGRFHSYTLLVSGAAFAPDLLGNYGKKATSVENTQDAYHLRLPAVLSFTGTLLLCSHVPHQPVFSDSDSQDTRLGANSGPRSCTGRLVHQITVVLKGTISLESKGSSQSILGCSHKLL